MLENVSLTSFTGILPSCLCSFSIGYKVHTVKTTVCVCVWSCVAAGGDVCGSGAETSNMEGETVGLLTIESYCSFDRYIRSDTSQILDETIPLIKDKVMEMNHIYAKVDKLEVC
uniref:Uncharacterized protein n=1 Tax=Dromaius novaehollandiae TaxID=8790 RepID=A0A8C4J987_DRONO